MSDETLDLDMTLPLPEVSPEEVKSLVAVLMKGPHWLPEVERLKARGWMTRKQIASQTGMCERDVRLVASAAAPAVVSYPGSPGYKLWRECTIAEIDHAIAAMEAQATDMIKRANQYRVARYKRFRASS